MTWGLAEAGSGPSHPAYPLLLPPGNVCEKEGKSLDMDIVNTSWSPVGQSLSASKSGRQCSFARWSRRGVPSRGHIAQAEEALS